MLDDEIFNKIVDMNNLVYDDWDILKKDDLRLFCEIAKFISESEIRTDYLNLSWEDFEAKYSEKIAWEYEEFLYSTVNSIHSCIIRSAQDIWDNLFSRSFDALKTLEFNDNLRDYIYYLLESAKQFSAIRKKVPECIDKIRAIYNIHTFVYNDDKKPKEKKEKEKSSPIKDSRTDSKRPKIL